jgi:peptidoglycan-N-acetylglucosamine deacetylase
MKFIIRLSIFTFLAISSTLFSQPISYTIIAKPGKPKIAFTFDDGNVNDMPNYPLEVWNEMLLNTLKKHNLKTVLFACGSRLFGEKGDYILNSWDAAGQKIGNHTYSHLSLGSKNVTLEQFEDDFMRNDNLLKKYHNYYPYFRFPYLKEGDTQEKISGFRYFLGGHDYKNGHVTIDASDWYIQNRLVKQLEVNPKGDISAYKTFYIAHLYDRAMFYDSLATKLTGRKISHIILLHHNLTSALFLDDLLTYFEAHGWEIMDADKAYEDPIYEKQPTTIPAGESLIWSLAKESGRFEKVLRYPAEDGEYEKEKMDRLGL